MNKLSNELQERLSRSKIKDQLNRIYVIAIMIPILTIGGFLLLNTSRLLNNYHRDMIESQNVRIKTILFELTSQVYNISETIALDKDLQDCLSRDYKSRTVFENTIKDYSELRSYVNNYAEISDVKIYLESAYTSSYDQIYKVDAKIKEEEWYKKGSEQFGVFWYPIKETDKYGNEYWNLALIRKIPLTNEQATAILVITISDNYLKSRIDRDEYLTLLSIDNNVVFYSSDRKKYGTSQPVDIDFEKKFFEYSGAIVYNNKKYMTNTSTLELYQSDSKLYVSTLNSDAYTNVRMILAICASIILIAIIIPGFLIRLFTRYFTRRVDTLREEMHKASNEDYDLKGIIQGEDEISEAFTDLKIMVQKIKEKDAIMYESLLKEQNLINEQQVMEFKMLASQINPHFLYNTLESIRMKALTGGNKEVANAIKLLGKSMRYVLENTGTASTTLKNELEYIEIYLMIQKLRFGDRVNYELHVEEGMNLGDYQILPLLLQPVVENAILHGLEETEENGKITIEVSRQEDEILIIDIIDNGCGMSEYALAQLTKKIRTPNLKLKSSIGLYNINERIRLCYGKEYGMHIWSRKGEGTKVSLVLPLIEA